jgi:glycosyltransferase involved in cell wall biosynthesis
MEMLDSDLSSVRSIFRSFYNAVAARHDVVFLPPEYGYVPAAEQERIAEEFVQSCDVIAGWPHPATAAARRRVGKDVPLIRFFLGEIAYGAWYMKSFMDDLNTNDVFLVNCASDLVLAEKLFTNLPVAMVPLPFDPGALTPLGADERRDVRHALGIGEDDRVLLYLGRIIPEKNVHTLLRIFSIVLQHVPDAHLVLGGTTGRGDTLHVFDIDVVGFSATIKRLIEKLELPAERIHLVGEADAGRVRELYGMADVKVNLTLNPDENFGLTQVEAPACGTPVVGTAWGGLKDTIVDGVTGRQVSTVSTATGPKASWWEAANAIVSLLEDGSARERFRATLPRYAERFTDAAFAETIDGIMCTAAADRGRPAEPLRATAFAEEFWSVCDVWKNRTAQFRRGPRSQELHRELLTPYSGATPHHVPTGDPLEPDQVVTLATPVHVDEAGGVRPDHVFFPHRIEVPEGCRDAVLAILEVLREEPAITVERLTGTHLRARPGGFEALSWLMDMGLVLRTRHVPGWIDPATVDSRLGKALFSVQRVARSSMDLVVYD